MNASKEIWNSRYLSKRQLAALPHTHETWFEPWLPIVGDRTCKALDLGCGDGHNSAALVAKGFEVTATDISFEALQLCRTNCPQAALLNLDIACSFPFPACTFELIFADLSLHYFDWATTGRIVHQLEECLTDSGLLLARFNSANDVNWGSQKGVAIGGDTNFRTFDGLEKRFFTEDCFARLFSADTWEILHLAESTSGKYGKEKACWELAAQLRVDEVLSCEDGA